MRGVRSYMFFSGRWYEPGWGMKDCAGYFDSGDDGLKAIKDNKEDNEDWIHVLDMENSSFSKFYIKSTYEEGGYIKEISEKDFDDE